MTIRERHFGDAADDRGGAFRAEAGASGPSALRRRTRRVAPADRSRARHWLPRRDVEPVRVELLVERHVVGGEPRQLVGGLDGVRVATLALLEAGAGTDIRVPA